MKSKAKKSGKVSKQAQKQNAPKAVTGALPAPRRLLGLPRWAVILLVVGLVAGASFVVASFAVFDFLRPDRIPPQLVGQWRVIGGPMDGMTLEFQRHGAMIGRAKINDNEGLLEGTAEATGQTLRTTTTNPYTRKAETGTQTIVTLTENELVTEDQKGTRVTMVRAR